MLTNFSIAGPEQHYSHFTRILELLSKEQFPQFLNRNKCSDLEVIFPSPGALARKVISRSNHHVTYKIPSRKNHQVLVAESNIEANGIYAMEGSRFVESYRMQPAEIRFKIGNEWFSHYPDAFALLLSGKQCFFEFKTEKEAFSTKIVDRTRALAPALIDRGYHYIVVIGEQVGNIPTNNTRKLLRNSAQSVPDDFKEFVRRLIAPLSYIKLKELLPYLQGFEGAMSLVNALLLNGTISYDYLLPLSYDTNIYWAEGEQK